MKKKITNVLVYCVLGLVLLGFFASLLENPLVLMGLACLVGGFLVLKAGQRKLGKRRVRR